MNPRFLRIASLFFSALAGLACAAPAWAAPVAATQPAPAVTAPLQSFTVLPPAHPAPAEIGSNTKASGYKLKAWLISTGGGLYWTSLTDYHLKALDKTPYAPLRNLAVYDASGQAIAGLYDMAGWAVYVDGSPVDVRGNVWSLDSASPDSATYVATIAEASGRPVLRISRTFHIAKGSYDIGLDQQFTNLSGRPLKVVWRQTSIADIAPDLNSYRGDQREFAAGYFDLSYDPQRTHIYSKDAILPRLTVVDDLQANPQYTFWPTQGVPSQNELVWLGTVNRYFAMVVHPALPPATATQPLTSAAIPPMVTAFPHVGMQMIGDNPKGGTDTRQVALTLTSRELDLAPGTSTTLNLGLFVGPRDPTLFDQPAYSALGFSNLVIYNLGGFCAFCTFQPLAKALLILLKGIYFVVRDWGIAIIVLVLVVRGLLHPITRSSQVSMMRMQKQMAALQPQLQQLKKKYANDSKKLQEETMRLYRENHVNPANMLGCLPMFLQMPIWFALYAMLFYAVELRQQPALYGVFQAISGGHWAFLADLSSPDNFIPLPQSWWFHFPLLGYVQAINLLPFLMVGVFFLQMKYTTPPPANEQAEQQQKMMKWMTMIFPVFLYSMPAGLNLYILASTAAGIVDSYVVKQHIKREEESGTLLKPKPGRISQWMANIQKSVEDRQKRIAGDRLEPRK